MIREVRKQFKKTPDGWSVSILDDPVSRQWVYRKIGSTEDASSACLLQLRLLLYLLISLLDSVARVGFGKKWQEVEGMTEADIQG